MKKYVQKGDSVQQWGGIKYVSLVLLSIFLVGCVSSAPEVKTMDFDQNIEGAWRVAALIVNGQATAPSGKSGIVIFKQDQTIEIFDDQATLLNRIMYRGYSEDEARVLLKESESKKSEPDPLENMILRYTLSSGSFLSVDIKDKKGENKGVVQCLVRFENSNVIAVSEFKVPKKIESAYPDIKNMSIILARK